MTYADLIARLQGIGLERIERDDRLLDVYPNEQRDKGNELWECEPNFSLDKRGQGESGGKIYLLRISEPYNIQRLELFAVSIDDIVRALTLYETHHLDKHLLLTAARRPTVEWIEAVEKLFKQTK
ncbi:MAG: hypothetical protein COT71_01535 [Candidatus Andersenbacteria bacterium CG10_big_fil_rev_8_21_14_0_10_54_11]|uniref:Uncharacterized protein n=1 Tax=Candidatus Andersenbacteria bacterium CG10_big_fil_rev_8_21_14_0_10_54_11 TaxID=1974485 RepID=A0A2M6WZV3_9BACT|nr:MAG: hypothetical protein COT71_01535 [Candidatus Andersenbacteria bacterium CG10_big_fil_rev_8_21_14_0_10_54_11]